MKCGLSVVDVQLAKAIFMRKQQPLDACLFYLAMKKQSLIKGLFKYALFVVVTLVM